MPHRTRVLVITTLLMVMAPRWALSFECAAVAPSASRAPAYQMAGKQQRCEGFFEKKVSQPFIELVSLTRGPLPVATGDTLPPLALRTDTQAAARLVVQPQRSNPYYRMDAALPAGQVLSWDATTMLAATGLRLSDLGFLALVAWPNRATNPSPNPPTSAPAADTGAMALAPVLLSPSGTEPARALAVVRVSVAVSSVAWRSYRTGPGAAPVTAWADLDHSRLFAWQRLALPIDLPADGQSLRVDVQALGADDGRALPLLRFTIVGPRDAGP